MEKQTTQQPEMAPPKKKGMPTWLKVIIVLIVFVLVIVLIATKATSGLTAPVNNQLDLLKNNDIKGAYELTSKQFQEVTSLEVFTQFVKQYPSLLKNKTYSFNEKIVENNIGTLKGTLTSEDGTVTPIEYKLVKENGEWKILSIEINPTEETGSETEKTSPTE